MAVSDWTLAEGIVPLPAGLSRANDPTLEQHTFTIVGEYAYPDGAGVFGSPERLAAVLPPDRFGSFSVLASAPAGQVSAAKEELIAAARIDYGNTRTSSLFGTSGLDFVAEDMYQVSQLKGTLDQTLYLFALLAVTAIILAGVGAFSLSVLNTTKWTREIGVRRALGASWGQVSVEVAGSAASLAALATTIGVVLAWLAAPALTRGHGGKRNARLDGRSAGYEGDSQQHPQRGRHPGRVGVRLPCHESSKPAAPDKNGCRDHQKSAIP